MAFSIKKSSNESAGAKKGRLQKKKAKASGARAQQFILFVGDEGAILIYMEGMTVVRRLFAPTAMPEHTRSMVELMAQHPKAPISMLFDVIDQQYIRQTFPPVSALSVEGLVKRRLDRDFPAEDLRGSLRLGREDTTRKDWIYLLISLANTANFQQWIDLVVERPNRLLGVYLLPVECQSFIPILSGVIPNKVNSAGWQMLISHHKVSGFRIVVLNQGKLAFTRVSQAVGEDIPAVLAGNIEQEIQNTIEYIRRLGYSESMGLEVFAVLASEVRDSIDTKRINASAINLLSPVDVAEALGLKQAALAADRFGDVVMACGFALTKKPSLALYPAYAKKLDQLFKAKIGARIAASIITSLLLFLTGAAVISGFGASSEGKAALASLAKDTPTLDLLKKEADGLGKEINFKNDVAAFYKHVKPSDISPLSALNDVAQLKRPQVSISEWEWSTPTVVPNADGTSPTPVTSPDGKPQAGPVTIKAKVALNGSFPDNETVIAAVEAYKSFLEKSVTRYEYSINNPEFGATNTGKISVALSNDENSSGSGGQTAAQDASLQAPVLDVELKGPKAETQPTNSENPAVPVASPMGGMQ